LQPWIIVWYIVWVDGQHLVSRLLWCTCWFWILFCELYFGLCQILMQNGYPKFKFEFGYLLDFEDNMYLFAYR
jgi:hypothetical protein